MRKGKKHKEETKEKIRKGNLNKIISIETKNKISNTKKKLFKENKLIPTKYWKGKKMSKEHKEKISKSNKGHPKTLGMTGKHQSIKHKLAMQKFRGEYNVSKRPEVRLKISKSRVGKNKGKDNPRWLGGSSFEPYSVDWTDTLKKAIRERDNYVCQICNQYGFIVHHINYNKKDCSTKNLITLCRKCHSKTNNNRDKWLEYFKRRIECQLN